MNKHNRKRATNTYLIDSIGDKERAAVGVRMQGPAQPRRGGGGVGGTGGERPEKGPEVVGMKKLTYT